MKHSAGIRLALNLLCSAAAALLLSTQADSASAQDRKSEFRKQKVQPMFKTILNWIPTDTETLVVTKGPYQIEVRDEDNPRRLPLMKYLEGISYSPLGNARKGGYLKKLQGQEIALAVEGARAFRSPKSLGL